jgi:periplasmic divalent cation tolerance protein
MPAHIILMLTTVADAAAADKLALEVLTQRLAACATRLAAASSLYRWEGQLETATEYPVLFKTAPDQAAALEAFIAEHHPYEVPEIVAWDAAATPSYAQWVIAETR